MRERVVCSLSALVNFVTTQRVTYSSFTTPGGRTAWIHYRDGRSAKYAESMEQACDGSVFTTLPSPDGALLAKFEEMRIQGVSKNTTINATVSLLSTDDQRSPRSYNTRVCEQCPRDDLDAQW